MKLEDDMVAWVSECAAKLGKLEPGDIVTLLPRDAPSEFEKAARFFKIAVDASLEALPKAKP